MQTFGRLGIFFSAWILVLPCAGAETRPGFKCIPDNGIIEYRELAVKDMQCEPLRRIPKASTDADAEMDKLREKVTDASQAGNSKDDARSLNCERAKNNASILEGEKDVIQSDAEGGKSVLGADQRAAALAQTQKDIAYWCN